MSEDYKLFSERSGYTRPKLPQVESMDDALRNSLWNAFCYSFPNSYDALGFRYLHPIYSAVWQEHLRKPADEYKNSGTPHDFVFVKDIFLKAEWFLVFDLIEFCLQELKPLRDSLSAVATDRRTLPAPPLFEYRCNQVLEKENSAYRIIEGLVTPITSKQEIGAIGTALRVHTARQRSTLKRHLPLAQTEKTPTMKTASRNPSVQWNPLQKKSLERAKQPLANLQRVSTFTRLFKMG